MAGFGIDPCANASYDGPVMPERDARVAAIRRIFRVAGVAIAASVVALALCAVYAFHIEPRWLKVRQISVSENPTARVVHISDIHHKGDRRYLEGVVDRISAIDADLVCLTGDLVEDVAYLPECLEILSGIQKPVFGVPGNHDHLGLACDREIRAALRAGGGDWLIETNVVVLAGAMEIVGSAGRAARIPRQGAAGRKRILLTHYPDTADEVPPGSFDLILAGHTHGGQVRIPLLDRPVLGDMAAPRDRGLFRVGAGPLYVNPGIGTFLAPVRFACRPEITVIAF